MRAKKYAAPKLGSRPLILVNYFKTKCETQFPARGHPHSQYSWTFRHVSHEPLNPDQNPPQDIVMHFLQRKSEEEGNYPEADSGQDWAAREKHVEKSTNIENGGVREREIVFQT